MCAPCIPWRASRFPVRPPTMSRRRGEFANRTSIFEGAFRAWSHLGGLAPEDMESRPARELDPLDFPLAYDARRAAAAGQKKKKGKEDAAAEAATGDDGGGGERGGDNRDDADGAEEDPYPYEPLPRAGLAHPFVRAILSSWLGPNADPESVRLGLTTLRTWWQHRRKGESGSARAALGSARMREIVNAYVRHFFRAALCLVATDGEEPPRTLRDRTRARDEAGGRKRKRGPATATAAKAPPGEFPDLRPRGQCIPRDIDLPDLVRRVNAAATQLAHRGRPRDRLSPTAGGGDDDGDDHRRGGVASPRPAAFPVPLAVAGPPAAAGKGGPRDVAFGMAISGITCAHCVKIAETVLLGCPGSPLGSPIAGLLDAAADLELELLLLKVRRKTPAEAPLRGRSSTSLIPSLPSLRVCPGAGRGRPGLPSDRLRGGAKPGLGGVRGGGAERGGPPGRDARGAVRGHDRNPAADKYRGGAIRLDPPVRVSGRRDQAAGLSEVSSAKPLPATPQACFGKWKKCLRLRPYLVFLLLEMI